MSRIDILLRQKLGICFIYFQNRSSVMIGTRQQILCAGKNKIFEQYMGLLNKDNKMN